MTKPRNETSAREANRANASPPHPAGPIAAELPDPEADPEEIESGANASFALLKRTVAEVAAKYPLSPGQQRTSLSFGLLATRRTITIEVSFVSVVDFLNDLARATVLAALLDVQFALAKRTSKAAADLESIWGFVIDVDRATLDILTEIERAGVPMPTFVFESLNGFKVAYVAIDPVDITLFGELARRLTLAFDGGDPTSWELSQMQRLPSCLKTTPAGIENIAFLARQTNSEPFTATCDAVPFPHRVARALGAGGADASARRRIREYLEDLGIPAPEEPGHDLYAACPDAPAHDSACCYVNVAEDGAISAHCLGGHGGEGERHWNEGRLAELAGAALGDAVTERFDPLRHLPVTNAAIQYIQHRLARWARVEVDAVVLIWARAVARREARGVAAIEDVLRVFDARVQGVQGLPPMTVYYERGLARLVHNDPDGRAHEVSSSRGPSLKTNATELKSTALWVLHIAQTEEGVVATPAWREDATSWLNKLAVGHTAVLAALGVAAVTTYPLPVAHVVETWRIQRKTMLIEAVTLRENFADVEEVNAIEFFLGLFRAGRLPLGSANDVLLFVVLLAAPLLRDVAPGHLGVFWFVGQPGAGKDFMAEMARCVWEVCAPSANRVSFDLNLAGDLELKRSLEMAAGRIYARAKEAGKRPGMADLLIRLAGTDMITVRGLYKNDVSIPNTFTYVAESAEDLPERREIYRRTLQISVTHMADSTSKGEVIEEVKAAAKGILKNLKTLVESRPPEYYLKQADTGSRPLVPAGLAKILGATLPPVEGEDLTEIFELMLAFVQSHEGVREGKTQLTTMQQRRRGKKALELVTLPSYRVSYFIEMMSDNPGNKELFSPYAKKSKELINRITRESDYRTAHAAAGHMVVNIGGRPYALRLGGRNFILAPEIEFTTKMLEARRQAAATRIETGAASLGTTTSTSDRPHAAGEAPHAENASETEEDEEAPTFRLASVAELRKRRS